MLLVPISEIKGQIFYSYYFYNLKRKMSDYQRPVNGVVPKLVSDLNLKRVRVETDDGPSIRVTGTFSGSSTDITPITDTLGTTSDTSSKSTLVGLTKAGNTTLGDKTDAAWSGSGSGSVIAILKSIYTKLQ